MPPLNLSIKVFGRPAKPVAFGLGVYMFAFVIYNIFDNGVFGASRWGDIFSIIAGSALALLCVSWILNSQRLAEVGLLLSCTVFLIRAVFIALTVGLGAEGLYYSIASAIIAGGSYFLERTDPQTDGGTR